MEKQNLLEVRDLHVSFKTYNGEVQAVRGVSFDVKKGRPWPSSGSPVAERVSPPKVL